MRTLTVTEAKAKLNELVEDAERTHEQVTITRHGHPSVVMVAADDFEALQETVFWLSQPGVRESLDESASDVAAGRGASSDELRRRLGLPPR
jgi:prevent-host-death family protein